jgi:nucleoside-diphosphate kinase
MKKFLSLCVFVFLSANTALCFAFGPKIETVEQTLCMIKPTAVRESHMGPIIATIEKANLRIVALKMTKLSDTDAKSFYAELKDKPFFAELVSMMTSGPIVAMVVEGQNAIARTRELVGDTDPKKAKAGTIRKLFGKNISENAIHASDSAESAINEIPFFFNAREIYSGSYR